MEPRSNNILRDTVHNPVRSVVRPAFGNEGAKVVAVLATFMVSGLMHELFLYNLAHASPTWEMTWYFVLQGVGLVAELWVKKVVGEVGFKWVCIDGVDGGVCGCDWLLVVLSGVGK